MLHQLDHEDDENEWINDEDLEELRELAEGDDQLLSLLEQERKFREKYVSAQKKDEYELQLMEQVEKARSMLNNYHEQYDVACMTSQLAGSHTVLLAGEKVGQSQPVDQSEGAHMHASTSTSKWLWSTFKDTVKRGVANFLRYDIREEIEEEMRKEKDGEISKTRGENMVEEKQMPELIEPKREMMKLMEKINMEEDHIRILEEKIQDIRELQDAEKKLKMVLRKRKKLEKLLEMELQREREEFVETDGLCPPDTRRNNNNEIISKDFLPDVVRLLIVEARFWNSIGQVLRVSFQFREELRLEGIQSSFESKLERVLHKWVESESSEISWDSIIFMLKDLKLKETANKVEKYLLQQSIN